MKMTSIKILLCWALVFSLSDSRRIYLAEVERGFSGQQRGGTEADSKQSDLDFKETSMGEAVTAEGFHYPFHDWKSNDGVAVTSAILTYNSSGQAREAFLKRLTESSKVIERSPRIGKSGRKRGERAIATFSYPGRKEEFSGILWTDGREFHDVESLSLRHALAFEQKFYPGLKPLTPVPSR